MKLDRILWILTGTTILALLAIAMYRVSPQMNPEISQEAPLDPNCDLRAGPCVGVLPGGGKISFSIEPKSIPLVEPLQLHVEVSGISAHSAEVDFTGIGMQMGYNRARLFPGNQASFSGIGALPVCIRSAMEWEAKVLINTGDETVAAPFRFITIKSRADLPDKTE